jgi:hypothetical protein
MSRIGSGRSKRTSPDRVGTIVRSIRSVPSSPAAADCTSSDMSSVTRKHSACGSDARAFSTTAAAVARAASSFSGVNGATCT